jgi:hypothetical protein
LTQSQNFAADFTQIVHRLEEFRLFFAETEHHAALGYNAGRRKT